MTIADPRGNATSIFYTAAGLVDHISDAQAHTTAFAYDARGNRTSFTDPESGVTSYVYDTLNRLTTLTPPAAISASSFGFTYDALSRRTQMTRPNGVYTSYSYDNLSRLLSVLHQVGATTIDGATYTVDAVGNRTVKTNQLNSVTENYGYDAIYQLLQVAQGATMTESYGYDLVGNRLSSLGVSPYSYNNSNQLTSTPTTTYTYDNNGNTLTKTVGTDVTSYAWDFENRLVSVTLPGGSSTVSFKYDPFGRRIQKSSASGTTNYAYDGADTAEEVDAAGSALARYTMGPGMDQPLAMLRGGATSYYQADGLGTITSLTDGPGGLAVTYTYDSFGKLVQSSGTLVDPFRYTGREFDLETGLYFYRARYYDSVAGRFLSEDPIQFVGGTNFYGFVGNNPVVLTDAMGLAPAAPLPTLTPWTQAEEAAYQAFVQGLKATSKVLSKTTTAGLVVLYLFDPSSGNNAQWANSLEYQFERKHLRTSCQGDDNRERCRKVREDCGDECWAKVQRMRVWPQDKPGLLRKCIRKCMEKEGCYDF